MLTGLLILKKHLNVLRLGQMQKVYKKHFALEKAVKRYLFWWRLAEFEKAGHGKPLFQVTRIRESLNRTLGVNNSVSVFSRTSVAVRMLCPFLFHSRISMFNNFQNI